MTKLILIASMYRTGGTYLYNVVRESVLAIYGEVYGCYAGNYDPTRPESVHVVKIARYNEELANKADKIFSVFRPKDEVIASMKRRAGDNPGKDFVNETDWQNFDKYNTEINRYAAHGRNQFNYHNMVDMGTIDFVKVVSKHIIFNDLKRNLFISDVIACEIDNLKIPESGHNPETLYHEGHITSETIKKKYNEN